MTDDPADLQVNTTCDPFSRDVYCSWLTGPVTEGNFFASGDPFVRAEGARATFRLEDTLR